MFLDVLLGTAATGAFQAVGGAVSKGLGALTGQRVNVPCEGSRHASRAALVSQGIIPPDVAAAQGYTGTEQDKLRVMQIIATNPCQEGAAAQAWLAGQGRSGDGSLSTRTSGQGVDVAEERRKFIQELRDAMFVGGARTAGSESQEFSKTQPGLPTIPAWVPYAVVGAMALIVVVALASKRK
jgi:hypothetical protein